MPTFSYTAVDRAGRTVTGTMEAPDDGTVRGKLAAARYAPVSIAPVDAPVIRSGAMEGLQAYLEGDLTPVVGPAGIVPEAAPPVESVPVHKRQRAWARRRVSSRDLGIFYRQMAAMLRSGVPLFQALNTVRTGMKDRRLYRALVDMEAGAVFGRPLSAAMDRHAGAFPSGHTGLVRLGEGAGRLPGLFEMLADQMDADWRVEIATRWNPMLFCVRWLLTPVLAAFFLGFGGAGAGATGIVAMLGIVGLLGFTAYPLLQKILRPLPGANRWEDALFRIPVVGARRQRADRVRTIRALSAALDAGIPLSAAWSLAADAPDSDDLFRAMMAQAGRIRRGAPISEALEATGAFREDILDAARAGEMSGRLPEMLLHATAAEGEEAALIGDLTPWVLATIAYFLYLLVGTMLVLMARGAYGA